MEERILGNTVSTSGPPHPLSHFSNIVPLAGVLKWQSGGSLYGLEVTELGIYKTGKAGRKKDPQGSRSKLPKMQPPHLGPQKHFWRAWR